MLDPGDEETRVALARMHLAAGRAERAVEILERIGAVNNSDAVRALGEALVRVGRTAEGEKRLQESERRRRRRSRTIAASEPPRR